MTADPLRQFEASALASMFDAGRSVARPWEGGDLAAVLRHQLAAPLAVDLCAPGRASAERVARLITAADPPLRTFYDLLSHPAPPVELLELTKRLAKRARADRASALPEEVAAFLYFASIHTALKRVGARISTLDDRQLRDGIEWVLAQPWLDPSARALFDDSARTDPAHSSG